VHATLQLIMQIWAD